MQLTWWGLWQPLGAQSLDDIAKEAEEKVKCYFMMFLFEISFNESILSFFTRA
jgi:hypothetical protein